MDHSLVQRLLFARIINQSHSVVEAVHNKSDFLELIVRMDSVVIKLNASKYQ